MITPLYHTQPLPPLQTEFDDEDYDGDGRSEERWRKEGRGGNKREEENLKPKPYLK